MAISPQHTYATRHLTDAIRQQARRGLGIFFGVLIPISVVLELLTIRTQQAYWIFLLMWAPALAALIARLTLREGPADVSFRLGGRSGLKALALAIAFPVIVGGLAYGVAWAAGLATFVAPPAHPLIAALTGGSTSSAVQFGALLLLALSVGLVGSGIAAAGEEIGWRGYMLTRLIDAGVPAPMLTGGLIWGLWHTPLILAGQYAAGPSVALSALLFLVSATVVSVVFGRLRLATGSIWPAIVLHASWNSVIQQAFDQVTSGEGATLWVGESGILVAMALVVAGLIAARGSWPVIRRLPRDAKGSSLR